MNQIALQSIRAAISEWKSQRKYTYENKQVFAIKHPFLPNEYILRFVNSVYSFFCDSNLIEVSLQSKAFPTGTLSSDSISENQLGDKYRLEQFLKEFDDEFYAYLENQLSECNGTLTTSDPMFF